MIEVSHLTRTYQRKAKLFQRPQTNLAVDDVSFQVAKGEIFGLLGQNGAGKTTTIKTLTTMLLPTSGTCHIDGLNVATDTKLIRQRINFIFGGELGMYRRLSAKDNLAYFATLYKLPASELKVRIPSLLALVGLTEAADQLVETFSKGMIQRLQIARGLINSPEVLFLDEPTIGLDAIGARQLRDIIRQLKQQQVTLLLTTHYLQEAEELCDRIAIMNRGRILITGTPQDIACYARGRFPETNIQSLEDAYVAIIQEDMK